MQNSIKKYVSRPVVQQTSTLQFHEIPKPLVYICDGAQFDYPAARENGYQYYSNYVLGMLTDSHKITWKGKFGNRTFGELQKILFNDDFVNSLTVLGGEYKSVENISSSKIYIAPYGTCLKFKQSTNAIEIRTQREVLIFLVDPLKENTIRLSRKNTGVMEIGPVLNGFHDLFVYDVEIILHDSTLYDGYSCIDYDKVGSSFGGCIETAMKDSFLEWYGCLPPWITNVTEFTCEQDRDVKKINADLKDNILNEMVQFLDLRDLDLFKHCLSPCLSMSFKFNLIDHSPNQPDYGAVKFKVVDAVTVVTDVLAYDLFSLVVDLGSALGLWLGLSALSIFDNILLFYRNNKTKFNH